MATTEPPDSGSRLRGEVKAELARRGLTRQWLADELDLSYWALNRRLNGDSDFTFAEVVRVAAALDIRLADFIARTEAA